MHPYVLHLLDDILLAHREEAPCDEGPQMSIEEELHAIEQWLIKGEGEHTFGFYCGLDAAGFPPPEQLTETEMRLVIKAFHIMMFSWNIGIDLPNELPVNIAYAMTVDTLNKNTAIPNSGMVSFDFCTGYAPDCIFKEYCPCLKIWNEHPKE